jgi:hypothetical protein
VFSRHSLTLRSSGSLQLPYWGTKAGTKAPQRRRTAAAPAFPKPRWNAASRPVGAVGFEPTTFRPPAECATRLRHAPGVRASLRLRKCSRCGELKTFEDFSGRRKKVGQRDSLCRPCRSANGREHYLANRPRYIEQARIQKQALQLERTTYLLTYFETHPCVDCGERDPVVLEFDHLRDKSFAIGPALSRRSWQAILDEMEKCEVVCANCHRRRTARRRGSLRAALTQEE